MDLLFKLFLYRLFSFNGRSDRKEYIIRFLTMLIFNCISVYSLEYTNHVDSLYIFILDSIFFIVSLLYFFQIFPLTTRRLHDLNTSGWWQLITFVPCGQLLMIGLIFFKGTPTTNKYGEPPT
jgi:uncharacterized membrane protein YhaH (DUF805 family)